MDQERIGKFIAELRKAKGLTQAQLAEHFDISNKAVSKWETGKSLPDASIMIDLCNLLGITVNELLSGERINMEDYKEKAEKNLVDMQAEKERLKKIMSLRKFSFYFFILVGLHGIACVVFQTNLFICAVCAILVVCAFIFVSESSKCPNCGRHGVIINPYSKKFGICKYCGNLGEREFFEED